MQRIKNHLRKYKIFRDINSHVFKRTTNASTEVVQYVDPIENRKKLALCLEKYYVLDINLNIFGDSIEVIEYVPDCDVYILNNKNLNFSSLKEKFEYIWFMPKNYKFTNELVANILLLLCKNKYDFVFISFLLKDMPNVAVLKEFKSNIVLDIARLEAGANMNFENSLGRIVRTFYTENEQIDIMKCESFFGTFFGISRPFYYDHKIIKFDNGVKYNISPNIFNLTYKKEKPCILVVTVYMFVGGVEKNTISVIKSLNNKYDFVGLTLEGIMEQNGSLHYIIRDYVNGIYDFNEILEYDQYINAIEDIKRIYNPDAVWFCNGSNWIFDNALKIKDIFKDTPIIDQSVYDTDAGWINRYQEKGIQSFDRFIAINRKIYNRFVNDFKMDIKKVDIIYSMFDISKANAHLYDKDKMRDKYKVPVDKKIFAFIGRMSPQKRPILLVKLIKEINASQTDNHFMLIGNGELKDDVKKLVEELNLMNVTMVDYIDDTCEVLCFLDGIMFVSDYEGLPIAMLEALVNTVPAISTDVGDVPYVLEKYNGGLVFNDNSDGNLNSKVEDFVEFKKNLLKYKVSLEKNKEEIKNEFSIDTIVKQWENSFDTSIKHFRKS